MSQRGRQSFSTTRHFSPPLEASPSNCRLRKAEMCPGSSPWGWAEPLEPGPLASYWECSVFLAVFKNSPFCSQFGTAPLAGASKCLGCCFLEPSRGSADLRGARAALLSTRRAGGVLLGATAAGCPWSSWMGGEGNLLVLSTVA